MKKLTLLGGAPLSGKTTLSKQIAIKDGAVEFSTDSMRDLMQNLVSKENYPGLHYSLGMSAEEFYEKYNTPESVVEGEVTESLQVQKGLVALLNTAITWEHLVIEGIAITPEFIVEVREKYTDREVEAYILIERDAKRVLSRISKRGLWGPLDTYPESLHATEVDWVMAYNKWFEEQAKKYNIKTIEI